MRATEREKTTVLAAIRRQRALVAFAALYVVALGAFGLVTRSRLTISYIAVILVLFVVVANIHAHVGLSAGVLWGLALWGLAHMAGGIIQLEGDRILYNADLGLYPLRYDRLVHGFGFGVATAACWQGVRARLNIRHVTGGLAVLVALAGMGVGAVNETIEFIASQLFETNVGGFVNTGWDLIFNTVGCTVVATSIWLRRRRAQPP